METTYEVQHRDPAYWMDGRWVQPRKWSLLSGRMPSREAALERMAEYASGSSFRGTFRVTKTRA